ncbi:PREDICTED: beta-lactoglobulin-like [Chrysochloris asiatica]|uniref:Beta-lactoglobulin-like n=1 Tax=Chrysochloris asiatica TaxID=185453 RepID=A0A9B0WP73_CHRAS|nr:PREDICTED: beta-lactoglobulin-like [Chrysochloris asiatica]
MDLGRRILLLVLGLGLASTQKTLQEVPLQRDLDAQKVEGRWLTLQLAATNPGLVSPDDPLRLFLHSIWTTGQGDLEFVFFWMGVGVCHGLNVTVHPTGLQGQYQGAFDSSGSVLVRFVGTDYRSMILYIRVEQDTETNGLWALLARSMSEDPKWLGRYLQYVRQFHLEEAPAFNGDGQCPPPEA